MLEQSVLLFQRRTEQSETRLYIIAFRTLADSIDRHIENRDLTTSELLLAITQASQTKLLPWTIGHVISTLLYRANIRSDLNNGLH